MIGSTLGRVRRGPGFSELAYGTEILLVLLSRLVVNRLLQFINMIACRETCESLGDHDGYKLSRLTQSFFSHLVLFAFLLCGLNFEALKCLLVFIP